MEEKQLSSEYLAPGIKVKEMAPSRIICVSRTGTESKPITDENDY